MQIKKYILFLEFLLTQNKDLLEFPEWLEELKNSSKFSIIVLHEGPPTYQGIGFPSELVGELKYKTAFRRSFEP